MKNVAVCVPEFSAAFITDSKPCYDGGTRVGEIMNVLTEKTKRRLHYFGPALAVAIIGGALSITLWRLVVALETRLLVEVTPESSGFTADGHWLSWIVLIFGLLLSGGMAFIIQASGRHAPYRLQRCGEDHATSTARVHLPRSNHRHLLPLRRAWPERSRHQGGPSRA